MCFPLAAGRGDCAHSGAYGDPRQRPPRHPPRPPPSGASAETFPAQIPNNNRRGFPRGESCDSSLLDTKSVAKL
eukprot:8946250-Pyramimonas_sp.AAC.1